MPTSRKLGAASLGSGAALLAFAALTGPSTADPIGADPCPAGTVLVAKYEVSGGAYVFEKPEGNEDVVTLGDGADVDGGTWSSTVPIVAVVVKGGSGPSSVDVDLYDPAATSGSFSNADLLNPGGNVPDISFVAFCGGEGGTTTSTEEPTTEEEPTTTEQPTSTSEGPTTTEEPTTTSQGPTTTDSQVLPTSVTASSTSTTAGTQVEGTQLARTGTTQLALVVTAIALLATGVVLVQRGTSVERS